MRTILTLAFVLLASCLLPAQAKEPPVPPGPKPVKLEEIKTGQKAQDPKGRKDAKQEKGAKKQDPNKKDPKGVQKKGDAAKTGQKPPYREKSKEEIEEEETPLGADPADLRAMKSAQDMLRAEKKLAALIKSGKIKGIDRVLPFEEIASWPYEDGLKGMPKALKKLEGKKVMMTGFMLPIDEVENIKEFLLVQSLWSCCYGQPPDINGTVRVVYQDKERLDYKFEPIKIVGTFRVKPTIEDGFCVDIYQLETKNVEVIK